MHRVEAFHIESSPPPRPPLRSADPPHKGEGFNTLPKTQTPGAEPGI